MTKPQQFLIYQSEDGSTRIDVMLEAETLWLSQKQLTELFGKAKGTVSEHIKHIFEDGELDENSVVRFFRTTAYRNDAEGGWMDFVVTVTPPEEIGTGEMAPAKSGNQGFKCWRRRGMIWSASTHSVSHGPSLH